eukprot:5007067-Amphidinium_carterae.1
MTTTRKGKRTNILCYYCGPGHTSDKCWWKGPIYSIDQSTPMWSVPNDVQTQRLQQLPPPSSASRTIMTQPQQIKLNNMQLYKKNSFQTTINSISHMIRATLTIDKNNTSKDQLRQWAILIDTGAMTSVASQDHFTHISLKPLRPQDPHTLTVINGKQLNIYGIDEVTLVYQNLAMPTFNTMIYHLRRQLRNTWTGHYHKEHSTNFASWYYTWYDEHDIGQPQQGLWTTTTCQEDAPGQPVYADDIVGDASQQETNVPKGYESPTLPAQQEIDEHNLTHLLYRYWCKHCVQGKSKSQHHQRGGLTKQKA